MFVNLIQGGWSPELTIQGAGAKTPAQHILAISQSFQLGLEWYQSKCEIHIMRPIVEKKIVQNFVKFTE